ncbi:MAG: hypothetical protein KAR06_02475 [Deltaproteobacteria bacterium]|nr:hypothetical protein [Deltaproteobacteria bacterium]
MGAKKERKFMHDTQAESWEKIKAKLNEKQAKVLDVLLVNRKGMTTREIMEWLGWEINSVSGRITELQGKGVVRDSGKRRKDPATNSNGCVWVARYPGKLF